MLLHTMTELMVKSVDVSQYNEHPLKTEKWQLMKSGPTAARAASGPRVPISYICGAFELDLIR